MQPALSLSSADVDEVEREYCRRSLSNFIKQAWPVIEPSQPYIYGWHIDAMAVHLEAVTRGEITRLLINIPPGTMKSLITGVFWPAWEWGPMRLQTMRYVAASHSQEFSVRDTLKMRRLVSSEWFQNLWPTPLTKDQNEKQKFENLATGFRQAMAMKSLTGTRGDRVLIDDPHSVEGALSDADRKTTLRVFTETVPTRLNNPDRSAIVVVMQRLHEDDVSGFILANDHGYDCLMLPMEFERERKCITRIGFDDPRTYDGELLFPERFSAEVVARDKKMMNTYAVAGQFQQRPSPRGGGLIKGANFPRYSQPPVIEYRSIYADTAQKTAERNDYSVLECWGYSGGKIYLLDLVRGKWEAPELERRAVEFWAKHLAIESAGALRSMIVEDKASGTGLIQKIQSVGQIPVIAQQRNRDKYSRIMDVLSYIEAGLVCLPASAPFTSDFVDECESFTSDDSHSHDDQIDPMIDAINDMLASNKIAFWENMI